jgi:hypothetical protein
LSNTNEPIKLDISEDKLKQIDEIINSGMYSPHRKKEAVKKILGANPCCICGSTPFLQIQSQLGDEVQSAIRIENYCESCYLKTKSDNSSIEYYGCIKAEEK